jgi:hypothetical protein
VDVLAARAQGVMPHAAHTLWVPWLATPAIALVLVGLALRFFGVQTWLAVAAGSGTLLASAAVWDQRSALTHAIEDRRTFSAHPWQALIPEQVPVLWPDHPEAIWALLQRPVFHDETQGAASVFNRELAMEFARQRKYFTEVRQAKSACELQHVMLRTSGPPSCAIPVESLGGLCSKVPGMRFFVGTEKWAPAWISMWRAPAPSGGDAIFHLHDCQRFEQTQEGLSAQLPAP